MVRCIFNGAACKLYRCFAPSRRESQYSRSFPASIEREVAPWHRASGTWMVQCWEAMLSPNFRNHVMGSDAVVNLWSFDFDRTDFASWSGCLSWAWIGLTLPSAYNASGRRFWTVARCQPRCIGILPCENPPHRWNGTWWCAADSRYSALGLKTSKPIAVLVWLESPPLLQSAKSFGWIQSEIEKLPANELCRTTCHLWRRRWIPTKHEVQSVQSSSLTDTRVGHSGTTNSGGLHRCWIGSSEAVSPLTSNIVVSSNAQRPNPGYGRCTSFVYSGSQKLMIISRWF